LEEENTGPRTPLKEADRRSRGEAESSLEEENKGSGTDEKSRGKREETTGYLMEKIPAESCTPHLSSLAMKRIRFLTDIYG
jgi:hypothetical protein